MTGAAKMLFRSLSLTLLSCINLTAASHQHHGKRGAETNATLYAYGADTHAWPIAYGVDDGRLYITQDPTNTTTSDLALIPLTWDLAAITDENWIANATFANSTSAGSMYFLQDEDDENYAIGVLPLARFAYINGTVSGFALFATQLVYNNDTLLQAQFWAAETDTTGVYGLVWTVDDAVPAGEFPVVVKAVEG
ncbi:uncharacterized protein BDV14DRAFT_190246 [Aspergillus stella-maris]|uniref:uncharacterized protein n=1 Tax=Aspergillus stella-maris TaxID=1810926 RepID=UPI003CCE4A67